MQTALFALLLLAGAASANRSLLQGSPTGAPGSTCATTGPANWWGCCKNKEFDGSDPTCELSAITCGNLAPEFLAECCEFKREVPDATCNGIVIDNSPEIPAMSPEPMSGETCGTTGPANWWYCCQDKDAGSDPTCPPPVCGELTTAIADCCYSKQQNGDFNDASCPNFTRVCFNLEQTEANLGEVISGFKSDTEGMDNATMVQQVADAAFAEIMAILGGNSEQFPSTIVS